MLISAVIGGLIIAGAGAAAYFGDQYIDSATRETNYNRVTKRYVDEYKRVLKANGMEDKDTRELIGELNMAGVLKDSETKLMMGYVDDIEKKFTKDGFISPFGVHGKKAHNEVQQLYKKLAENVPIIHNATYEASKVLPDGGVAFRKQAPKLTGVAAPKYFDTNFEGTQREVDPVKLWSGQELADLHGIDYDVNNYYDLLKARNQAQVGLQTYRSDALANRENINNALEMTGYLDSIRNSKANAITKGITQGSRAASELLNMNTAFANKAKLQPEVAAQRLELVDKAIKDSAASEINAYNAFNKLAQHMSTDSMSLYANDTARFGQDHKLNADMYNADQRLRGIYSYVNDSMRGAQAEANAAVNAIRSGMVDPNDEYAWIFNKLLSKNNNDAALAYSEMDNYLQHSYNAKSYPGITRYDYLVGKK